MRSRPVRTDHRNGNHFPPIAPRPPLSAFGSPKVRRIFKIPSSRTKSQVLSPDNLPHLFAFLSTHGSSPPWPIHRRTTRRHPSLNNLVSLSTQVRPNLTTAKDTTHSSSSQGTSCRVLPSILMVPPWSTSNTQH